MINFDTCFDLCVCAYKIVLILWMRICVLYKGSSVLKPVEFVYKSQTIHTVRSLFESSENVGIIAIANGH